MYAPNLKDVTNDEILNELLCYKVIKVENLLKDPLKSHVPLYLLTFLRPKDTCIHLDVVEEHHTNVTSLPASYRMMSG